MAQLEFLSTRMARRRRACPKRSAGAHLRDLTARRSAALAEFSRRARSPGCSIISRQRITQKTLALLFDLARAADLPARIAAMFRGDPINTTEQRAVLHTALRSEFAGSAAIQAEVRESRQKLSSFVGAVRAGREARGDAARNSSTW